jgi:hypothetical protein
MFFKSSGVSSSAGSNGRAPVVPVEMSKDNALSARQTAKRPALPGHAVPIRSDVHD